MKQMIKKSEVEEWWMIIQMRVRETVSEGRAHSQCLILI